MVTAQLRVTWLEIFISGELREDAEKGGPLCRRKSTGGKEQIATVLKQVEAGTASDTSTPHAFREAGITEQAFYCWHQQHRGLNLDQAGWGQPTKQGHHSKRRATTRAQQNKPCNAPNLRRESNDV
jgi:hypothetical protein